MGCHFTTPKAQAGKKMRKEGEKNKPEKWASKDDGIWKESKGIFKRL